MYAARRGVRAVLAALALATACSKDAGVADILVVSQVEITPPSSAIVVGQKLQLAATPKTEGGIPLPAREIIWSSSNIRTATVTAEGLVHAESVGGPVKIRATVQGVTGETDITVVAVPIDHIAVTPPTVSIRVGETTQLTATAFDAEGVPLTGRTFLWGAGNPETAAVTGTGLVLGMAVGGPVTISVSAEGKTASGSVTVTARPASRVGFLQQPTSAPAGASIAPAIKVAVQDDLMGTVTTATNSVTLALLVSTEGDATLSGTRTVAAVNGVATFSNLSINRTGTSYVLTATATGLNPATSGSFSIAAGAPARLSFAVAPPGTARSGVAFASNPVVQLRDAFGNAVESAGIVVTATTAGGTLGGATVATTAGSGSATFAGLSLTGPAGAYTISFTTPGIPPLVSGVIELSVAIPTTLNLTTQPSASAQSGAAFAVQPAVRLLDAGGGPVPQSGVVVTASIGSGPTGGSLTGTASVATDASGVATFTNLVLTGPAGSYLLKFSSPALASATSNTVTLGAGAGSALSVTTQPSSQASGGVPFAQQPAIQLLDAAGNVVALGNVVISAAIQSGDGTLGGTTTASTNSTGLASFTDLSLTGAPGERTLLFSATGYASVASTPISLTGGLPTQLQLEVEPSTSAQVGVAFARQPVLRVKDESGDGVSGVAVSVQVTKGNGTLAGITTVSTDATGRAAFAGLSLTGKLGNYKLTFSAGSLLTVTTKDITLKVGPPTQLLIITQPPSSVRTGRTFSTQPVLRLLDAGDNPVGGKPVIATVNSCSLGNSTLGGTTTVNTDSEGFARYSNLKLTGLSLGGCTLKFTAGSLSQISVSIFVGL